MRRGFHRSPVRTPPSLLSLEVFAMKSSHAVHVLCAAVILAAASAWFLPLPVAFPSTYAVILALVVGAGTVTLLSWRNALPTDTVAQLLHRTENDAAPKGRAR